MENSVAVANYFVDKAVECGMELTPMKLVKLVYLAHGWHLAIKGSELYDEDVQAWLYGPVVPNVYLKFRRFGSSQITEKASITSFDSDGPEFTFQEITPVVKSEDVRQLLDRVWDVYGKYNGIQLSALTHQPETPWDIAFNKLGGNKIKSFPIPNDLIKSHYKSLLNGRKLLSDS